MDISQIWLSFVFMLGSADSVNSMPNAAGVKGDSDDYPDSCLPQLADRCFKGLMPSLLCHMENKGKCPLLGDFCGLASDSLQCAADIIDNDCEDGRKNFDSWLQGLRAVKEKICGNNGEFLRVVTDMPCFNLEEFVDCVEEMTRVTHVVDLLQVSLNKNECNRVLISLPTCNVRSHPAHSNCYLPQEAINDIIYTFFSYTECGASCPHSDPVSEGTSLSTGSTCLFFFTLSFALTLRLCC